MSGSLKKSRAFETEIHTFLHFGGKMNTGKRSGLHVAWTQLTERWPKWYVGMILILAVLAIFAVLLSAIYTWSTNQQWLDPAAKTATPFAIGLTAMYFVSLLIASLLIAGILRFGL